MFTFLNINRNRFANLVHPYNFHSKRNLAHFFVPNIAKNSMTHQESNYDTECISYEDHYVIEPFIPSSSLTFPTYLAFSPVFTLNGGKKTNYPN